MSADISFESHDPPRIDIDNIPVQAEPERPATLDEQIDVARDELKRLHTRGGREAVQEDLGGDIDRAGSNLARLLRKQRKEEHPSVFSRLGRAFRFEK